MRTHWFNTTVDVGTNDILSIPSRSLLQVLFVLDVQTDPKSNRENECNGNTTPAPPYPASGEKSCLLEVSAPVRMPQSEEERPCQPMCSQEKWKINFGKRV
jgi:hypothetical protein